MNDYVHIVWQIIAVIAVVMLIIASIATAVAVIIFILQAVFCLWHWWRGRHRD